jgi:hypothetical protein
MKSAIAAKDECRPGSVPCIAQCVTRIVGDSMSYRDRYRIHRARVMDGRASTRARVGPAIQIFTT